MGFIKPHPSVGGCGIRLLSELARSIAACAPAMASLSPLPVMVLTPLLGEPATTSCPSSRKMATVFEPIRPVPPITTIFMGYPSCRRFKAATLAKNLRGFPQRRKHQGGGLGSTELCSARGIRGSCGGNVSIERRRRDAEVTPMPGLASLALAASMSSPWDPGTGSWQRPQRGHEPSLRLDDGEGSTAVVRGGSPDVGNWHISSVCLDGRLGQKSGGLSAFVDP